MTSLLDVLLHRRLVFVGGKGGVGKTTVAAALSVDAAARGRRCLVVSTDPAHSLGDVFGRRVGGAGRDLAPGLAALEIDPETEAARHVASVKEQLKTLVHPRLYDEVDRQLDLATSAPGTVEAALIERMADLMAESGRDVDLTIFDTAPTGHTLRLLALPEIMAAWTDGLLRHRERASRLGAMLGRFRVPASGPSGDAQSLLGTPDPYVGDRRAERLQELLRIRRRKLHRARELLLDREATGFLLVLNPDRLSILESRKAMQVLDGARIPVAAVVVNRILPPSSVVEPHGTGGQDGFLDARRRQEAPYLREIDRDFARLPRVRVPLFAADIHGVEELGRLGRQLTGE